MSPYEIAIALVDAIPIEAFPREQMVAVGMLATALVMVSPPNDRDGLVDVFCDTLRKSIRMELN